MTGKQRMIWTGFALFLGFMAVCTVVAKGIYKNGLPQVWMCRAEEMALHYEIDGMGVVLSGETYGVYVPQGLRVYTVSVRVGDSVAAGDVLFRIDPEDLDERIIAETAERDWLAAQIKDLDNAAGERGREKKKQEERLLADYESMVAAQDLAVSNARLAMDGARIRMENAGRQLEQGDGDSASEPVEPDGEEQGAGAAEPDPEGTEPAAEPDPEGTEPAAEPDPEGTEPAAEPDPQPTDNGDLAGAQLTYEMYRKEYEQTQLAVQQAELSREEAIRDWNRSLEEAKEQIGGETAGRVRLAGELAACERRLERLRELKEADGEVCAVEEGTVLGCLVQTGARTGDGACVLYTRTGDGVEVVLEESAAKLLSIGDKVTLKCKTRLGENRKLEGIVSYQESGGGKRTLKLDADVSGLPAGQTVQMHYSYNSEKYATVIPLSALYSDGRGNYVYVVERVEGILGAEYRTRKISVTVLESNVGYAAISGASVSKDSEIILSANKELSENIPVRVMPK